MPLTDVTIRNLNPRPKAYRNFDGKGLYLEVTPKGGKYWRLKYRFGGREKRLALGVYPEVSLKEARERRDRARELLRDDIDPGEHKRRVKKAQIRDADNSFEAVAREWFTRQKRSWTPGHSRTVLSRLEHNVFPWLGKHPIASLTTSDLLGVLHRIEDRGAVETAHRVLVIFGQVLRYAVLTERAERDLTADLRGALLSVRPKHLAALTDPQKVGELLLAIDGYEGSHIIKSALKFAPLVFVRPGELRNARWEDVDFENAEWRFTVTKTRTPHIVPLATQAVAILEDIQPLSGSGEWVFPGIRGNRPMSNNTINAALRSLGFKKEEMCAHGFRAMARTLLDEQLDERPDYIEHQLGHRVKDPLGRAYNRTTHLPERKAMMQRWADYLDGLRNLVDKPSGEQDG
jgi:integrase